jgi:uncharacterized protein involved in type VI secretion and phage assembly
MAKDMLQPDRQKPVTDKHIAQVVSIDDVEQFLRVKVRIQDMHPETVSDDDLPWAEYGPPPGNRGDCGTFIHIEEDDYVWVDFPHDGDIRRPRVIGSVHFCPPTEENPKGAPNFPHEAWQGPGAVEHKRIIAPMPGPREYGQINVFSEHGVVVEVRGDKSIIITQKHTKSAIEITKDGDITLHSEKDIYIEAEQNITMFAKQNINISAGMAGSFVALRSLLLSGGSTSILLGMGGGECEGDFHFAGNITGDQTIMDASGNTNHHEH